MPIYNAADVEVLLGTASLEQTTTTDSATFGVGKGSEDVESHQRLLEQAHPLKQRYIKTSDGGILHEIGRHPDKKFFYLVRVGFTPPDESLHSILGRPRRSALQSIPENEEKIDALALSIKLAKQSFRPGSDGKPLDLKVEVFYNGEFVSAKLHGEREPLHKLVFGGQRIDNSLERPWVLRHPRPESVVGPTEAQLYNAYQSKWELVRKSLLEEANSRGFDKYDRPSPTKDYLNALSTLPIPDNLARNQTSPPLDPNMGIIDVIITLGSGKKHVQGMEYSYGPARMADPLHGKLLPTSDSSESSLNPSPAIDYTSSQTKSMSSQQTTWSTASKDAASFTSPEASTSYTHPNLSEDTAMSDAQPSFKRVDLAQAAGVPDASRLSSLLKAKDQEDPMVIDPRNWVDEEPKKPPPKIKLKFSKSDMTKNDSASSMNHSPSITTAPAVTTSPSFATAPLATTTQQSTSKGKLKRTFENTQLSPTSPPINSSGLIQESMDPTTAIQIAPTRFMTRAPGRAKGLVQKSFSDTPLNDVPVLAASTTERTQVSPKRSTAKSFGRTKRVAKETLPDTPLQNAPAFLPSSASPIKRKTRAPPYSTSPFKRTPRLPASSASPVKRNNRLSSTSPNKSSPNKPKRKGSDVIRNSYDWEIPELSRDCVAGYALEGMVEGDGEGDIIPGLCRQIRKERSGEFSEDSVMFGVRFVVG